MLRLCTVYKHGEVRRDTPYVQFTYTRVKCGFLSLLDFRVCQFIWIPLWRSWQIGVFSDPGVHIRLVQVCIVAAGFDEDIFHP